MKQNIKEWAKINGLSPTEFRNEIFMYVAALGTMEIDNINDGSDTVIHTTNDGKSDIQVIVRRYNEKN